MGPDRIILISKKYEKRLEGRVQRGELHAPPPSSANRPSRRCMLVPADVDRHQLLTTSAKSHSCFPQRTQNMRVLFCPAKDVTTRRPTKNRSDKCAGFWRYMFKIQNFFFV